MSPSTSSYVCDTLPAPKLAVRHTDPPQAHYDPNVVARDEPAILLDHKPTPRQNTHSFPPPHPSSRKLCPRHLRMADEGVNLKLQQSLDALPVSERETVNAVWSNFSSSSHPRRALILQGLLTMCCFSQLSLLSEQLAHLIRLDPFSVLPLEVSLRILGHLDATSLCRAAQVSRQWRVLADDDILWRGICEQHIGQKCRKCGWSLPVLEAKRLWRPKSASPLPPSSSSKRTIESCPDERPTKRHKSHPIAVLPQDLHAHTPDTQVLPLSLSRRNTDPCLEEAIMPESPTPQPYTAATTSLLAPNTPSTSTRPWKAVYSERLTIERNWRRGRCTVRTLKGHTDGVMCLQYSETLGCPSFPVLITGSYDRTVRVWNMETGAELHCLKGHTRAVRALQFDNCKLITGSMDHTIRVWDWRRGLCIRTLTGHSEGVVCLNFDSNVLASGSVDSTIRVWNLRTGGAFSLRGHRDWVNAVQLWDSSSASPMAKSFNGPAFDCVDGSSSSQNVGVDPGKMLFSASDDGVIRLWNLNTRTCVQQFIGHMGQVQSVKVLLSDQCDDEDAEQERDSGITDETISDSDAESECSSSSDSSMTSHATNSSLRSDGRECARSPSKDALPLPSIDVKRKAPILMSGSLDNTIKLWDIETGKTERTLFGHIEGVWAVANDKLRMVSGSHDRTIKVWSREDGRCTTTLVGHCAAVTCLALGEDKIVSGSDDGDVKIWSFSEDVVETRGA